MFKPSKNDMLFYGGIAGIFAGVGLACFGILKLDKEYKKAADQLKCIEERKEEEKPEVVRASRNRVWIVTGLKTVGYLAPAAFTLGFSIYSLSVSRMQLKEENLKLLERNKALTAMYVGLDQAFKAYRRNTVERFGEEVDFAIMQDIHAEEIKRTEVDENGNETEITETLPISGNHSVKNPYVWYFDESNKYYRPEYDDAQIEYMFGCALFELKDLFQRDGMLELNTSLKRYGFDKCAMGMITGWHKDLNNPDIDNDVNITWHKTILRDIHGELHRAWAIEFHVDGAIYEDLVEKEIAEDLTPKYIEEVAE